MFFPLERFSSDVVSEDFTIKLLSGLWLVSKLGALSRENSKIE